MTPEGGGGPYAEYDATAPAQQQQHQLVMQPSYAHNYNQDHAHGVAPFSYPSPSSTHPPLHLSLQQQQQQQQPQQQQPTHHPTIMADGNDGSHYNNYPDRLSSLIYNRTIKVPKTNYSDHGSHGVAAYPLLHHLAVTNNNCNTNNMGQEVMGRGTDGAGGGAAATADATDTVGMPGNRSSGCSTNRGGTSSSISGYTLPSSVQMQLQMQQMNRSIAMSSSLSIPLQNHGLPQSLINNQQQLQQQQRFEQTQMLPPPPGSVGNPAHQLYHMNNHGNITHHSALLTSSMTTGVGSGQVYDDDGSGGGGGAGGLTTTMNATSSTELMEAFNAQIAANHAAINSIANAVALSANAVTASGGVGNGFLHNYLTPQSSSTTVGLGIYNNNLSAQQFDGYNSSLAAPPPPVGGGYINYDNTGIAIAPSVVDFRNGKKRTSPSIPLHPSQLQSFNNCGGITGNNLCNNTGSFAAGNTSTGMISVVEEGEESAFVGTNNIQVDSSTVVPPQRILQQYQQALNQPQQNVNLSNDTIRGAINQGPPSQKGPLHLALDQCLPEPTSIENSQPQQKLPDDVGNASRVNTSASASLGVSSSSEFIPNEFRHGKILTNPSIPSSNSGLDNSEGNLIVRRGDVFRIPKTNIHHHPPSVSGKPTTNRSGSSISRVSDDDYIEYKVVSLLGQGTFAQVFHCVDLKSEKAVAVKIVKNKPAYTRQAAVEIDVFRKLNASLEKERSENEADDNNDSPTSSAFGGEGETSAQDKKSIAEDGFSSPESTNISSSDKSIIHLMCYFMHCSHLCLVFEMLGPNLYEILKKRQFRGLPIEAVRTLVRQAAEGIRLLGKTNVVHCDLKPENILMIRDDVDSVIAECKRMGNIQTNENAGSNPKATQSTSDKPESEKETNQWIKLIDFGSACFEGQTAHTYIQSRFYRSPEVLIGLPYDSAIDIWSLGCVAAELFLGLPILPGVHEHDQLGRILEMVGPLPDWMVEQGSKSGKFFKHFAPSENSAESEWTFRTRQEYINGLTEEEKRSKGGLAKLEQQQTNRYFKRQKLEDIVMHHGICNTKKEREQLGLFVHFLKGLLHPDPWKRWTAHQVLNHPFLSGSSFYRMKSSSSGCIDADGTQLGVKPYDILWVPPWDASISRRKLIVIQKANEKEALQAQVAKSTRVGRRISAADLPGGGCRMPISQSVPEARAMVPQAQLSQFSAQGPHTSDPPRRIQAGLSKQSTERARSIMSEKSSPPQAFAHAGQSIYAYPSALSSSLGGVGMSLAFQQLHDIGGVAGPARTTFAGRSFSENMTSAQMPAQQQWLQASMSELYDVAMLQPPQPLPPILGAHSFSGLYYQGMPRSNYVESELGYALQRPGVVPGTGSLQRQSSQLNFNSAALLSQPSQMMSPSFSNLSSSTPRSHFAPPGLNSNYQAIPMSPGGLLLQTLGLQDQLFGGRSNTAGPGISLLSQQLEEYSHPDQQHGQYTPSRHTQYNMPGSMQAASASGLNPESCSGGFDATSATVHTSRERLPLDNYQRASFIDFTGDMHRNQIITSGSYHCGSNNDAPAPMSFTSTAYNRNRPHASSFSDFGSNLMPSPCFPVVLQNTGYDEIYSTDDPVVELQKRQSMG